MTKSARPFVLTLFDSPALWTAGIADPIADAATLFEWNSKTLRRPSVSRPSMPLIDRVLDESVIDSRGKT
jgi:hypothetical protein